MSTLYTKLLNKDWLERNNASFTSINNKNRIGWEENLGLGEAYSKYLFRGAAPKLTVEKKLFYTRVYGENFMRTILKGAPCRLILNEEQNFKNYSDAKTYISVSLEPMYVKNKQLFPSYYHALDVMLGAVVHETAHVEYTTADLETAVLAKPKSEINLYKAICNIVEDERIETLTTDIHAGYANYVASVKKYIFDNRIVYGISEEIPESEIDDFKKLFISFLYLVRYPKALKEEYVNTCEKELEEIMDILTPYPMDMASTITACDKILEVFKKKAEELGSDISNEGGGDEAEEGEVDMDEVLKTILEILAKSDISTMNKNSGDIQCDVTLKIKSSADATDEVNGMSQEKLEELHSELKSMETPPTLNTEVLATRTVNKAKHDLAKKSNTIRRYTDSYRNVAQYANLLKAKMQRFNRNQRDTYRGLSDGVFDEDALIEAKLGSKNVYKQTANVVNAGATIVLLIDESGSMSGTNISKARDIAVLFESALTGVNNVDFYCYGHTTYDHTILGDNEPTLLNVYYEGRAKGEKMCLGQIEADNTNRDGHALLEVVNRVRLKTKQPIVLFMISDGAPTASVPNGYTGISYTKHCVDYLERTQNCQIIHIAIEDGINSAAMFKNFVTYSNLGKLVNEIGGLLLQVITKLNKPKVVFE